MENRVVLGIPKYDRHHRYEKDVKELIEELKKHGIPFEIKEIDEPDAMPALALRPNSLVWHYLGKEEIMAFIECWESFWKSHFEELKRWEESRQVQKPK